jgi:hypothetical protein
VNRGGVDRGSLGFLHSDRSHLLWIDLVEVVYVHRILRLQCLLSPS